MNSLSQDLRRFLQQHIGSVAGLEVLLAIRAAGDGGRTVNELTRELTSSRMSVETRVEELRKAGLLLAAEEGRFVIAPLALADIRHLDELDRVWPSWRHSIIEAIYSTS